MKVRSYDQALEDSKTQVGIDCQAAKDGRTKQAFHDECTISKIVERAEKTGDFSRLMDDGRALYGDFSNVPDYQEALNLVARAEEQFAGLSAQVRDRFNNEPAEFLAFMEDPKNASEAIRLGLAAPRQPAGATDSGIPQGGAGQAGGDAIGQGGGATRSGGQPAASGAPSGAVPKV